jgi:hypothetical protein
MRPGSGQLGRDLRRPPFIARVAENASSALIGGRTIMTEVAKETSDESTENAAAALGEGNAVPFLARIAVRAPGRLLGRTILTKAQETTDD